MESAIRKFETGATRDTDTNKLKFEGFISPLVTKRYAQYMHLHRKQKDGSLRDPDNWQKGLPLPTYADSLVRHVEDFKLIFDGFADEAVDSDVESVLCAIIFNASGYLFETLKEKRNKQSINAGLDAFSHALGYSGTGSVTTPPCCQKHKEPMVLNFYDRPGSAAAGNGWACRTCIKEREANRGVV